MDRHMAWLRLKLALRSTKGIVIRAIRDAFLAPNYKAEKWAPPLIVAAGIVVYYWLT